MQDAVSVFETVIQDFRNVSFKMNITGSQRMENTFFTTLALEDFFVRFAQEQLSSTFTESSSNDSHKVGELKLFLHTVFYFTKKGNLYIQYDLIFIALFYYKIKTIEGSIITEYPMKRLICIYKDITAIVQKNKYTKQVWKTLHVLQKISAKR